MTRPDINRSSPDAGAAVRTLHFVVSGYFGAVNVGDEAICRSVIQGIRSTFPDCHIDVLTSSAERSREFGLQNVGLVEGFFPRLLFWRNLGPILAALRRADLCIVGGGGLLQDVHSWESASRHLVVASCALLMGRPVISIGLGVGPLRSRWLRRLVGAVCSRFAQVQVRDRASFEVLNDCGVPPGRIAVTADPVLALQEIRAEDRVQRTTTRLPMRVALALRRWPGLQDTRVAETIEAIVDDGHEVSLLCYEPRPDSCFYSQVMTLLSSRHRERVKLCSPRSLDEAIHDLRSADALIGMRLHSCILAARLGVPFVALSYDRKVVEFVHDLGDGSPVISVGDFGPSCWRLLTDRIHDVTDSAGSRVDSLQGLESRARKNFHSLPQMVGQTPSLRARASGFFYSLMLLYIGSLWLCASFVRSASRALPFWTRSVARHQLGQETARDEVASDG